MSLFEFTFGLSAVILGLALAQMATALSRLAMAGRRVRWAPEPLLLAGIVVLVIVSVWLNQWGQRDETQTTIGAMLMQIGKLLLPFMAAMFVLPDPLPDEGPIDLHAHYDRTRRLTYGVLIAGLLAFWAVRIMDWAGQGRTDLGPISVWKALLYAPWVFCALYAVLMVVRVRWINVVLLAGGLIYYGWEVIPQRLAG